MFPKDRTGFLLFLLTLSLSLFSSAAFARDDSSTDEVSVESKGRLARIKSLIDQAGSLFKDEDFSGSAKKIRAAQRAVLSLSKEAEPAAFNALKGDYDRLLKAQKLLANKGEEFDEIPDFDSLKEMPGKNPKSGETNHMGKGDAASANETDVDGMKANGDGTVSFTRQVAPIVIQHCGRCHVQQSKGQYSARTYVSLMKKTKKGTPVKPGDVEKSRLITLIEDGSMPPTGEEVPEEQLTLLKTWIEEGAKFDGADNEKDNSLDSWSSGANGNTMTGGGPPPGASPQPGGRFPSRPEPPVPSGNNSDRTSNRRR